VLGGSCARFSAEQWTRVLKPLNDLDYFALVAVAMMPRLGEANGGVRAATAASGNGHVPAPIAVVIRLVADPAPACPLAWNAEPVQLEFSQDDEAGFARVRGQLLDGFDVWLKAQRGLDEAAAHEATVDAGIALDWKFGYCDGHLGRWTTDDVADFLLSWCPRKLSVSQADCVTIPGSVAAFTDYLAAGRLLASGSASPARLRAAATGAAGEFVAVMGDPANFGLAKSIFSGALADGADASDPVQLEDWVTRFNSLSDEERKAVLPDSAFSAGGAADRTALPSMALPPVPLPPPEAVQASEAAAPVLRMFAELARFAVTGRQITQRGNLTMADARALVPLLGTGDVLDERIGDRAFRTRSSAELPVLNLVFTWAKKAGILRVRHGKVLATKRGLALAGNPAAEFGRVLDALLAAGPLTAQRVPGSWLNWPEVDELLDSIVLHLLVPPYASRRTVPIAKLAEMATEVVRSTFVFDRLADEHVAGRIGWDVARIADALELAGVLRRSGAAEQEPGVGHALRPGGDVELTPAGAAVMQKRLPALGYNVPVARLLATATAAELVAGLDAEDSGALIAEVDAWLDRRTPEQAAAELAAAVADLDEPALQHLALAMLTDLGPELVLPQVQLLANNPASRGFALCWLADNGMLGVQALYDPGDPDSFAQVLFQRLVMTDPAGMLATLALAGDDDRQARLATELGRSPAPSAESVLEAIGAHHPVRTVAKAARKALFLRRSRAAARHR
jgi:hypothetical protein